MASEIIYHLKIAQATGEPFVVTLCNHPIATIRLFAPPSPSERSEPLRAA